jgi:hypothetical protein
MKNGFSGSMQERNNQKCGDHGLNRDLKPAIVIATLPVTDRPRR